MDLLKSVALNVVIVLVLVLMYALDLASRSLKWVAWGGEVRGRRGGGRP